MSETADTLLVKIQETLREIAKAVQILVLFVVYVALLIVMVAVRCAVFALKTLIVAAWCVSILLCLVSVWRIYALIGDNIGATLAALALTLPVVLLPQRETDYGGLVIASILGGAMYIIAEHIGQNETLRMVMAYALPIAAVVTLFVRFYHREDQHERLAEPMEQMGSGAEEQGRERAGDPDDCALVGDELLYH